MDYRSFHLHYECVLWMCNEKVLSTIHADLENTMKQCKEVSYESGRRDLYS